MKLSFLPALLVILLACNNAKQPEKKADTRSVETTDDKTSVTSTGIVNAVIDGKEMNLNGSLLVSKDKDHLQAGADYMVVMTASGGENASSLTINFLIALKEGTYPVVGSSFVRGDNDHGEVYGGLLGGKPKITDHKVTLTQVKDLGPNNLGGHKWSISGSIEPLTIDAMKVMLMDESKHHPKQVSIDKVSFTNLSFDDNWEEIMNKAMEQLKKAN